MLGVAASGVKPQHQKCWLLYTNIKQYGRFSAGIRVTKGCLG